MQCKEFLKEYAVKLLELVIEVVRNYRKCLEIFESKINSLPDYIKDDAKWAFVYLKLSDREVPKVIHDSFKSLQSKDEAVYVFTILTDKLPSCEYNELEMILKELSKIRHSKEIAEFLCECMVIMIKEINKIGIFHKQQDIGKRLSIMITTLSEKTKDLPPSKSYNRFWTYFIHFQLQSDWQNKESFENLCQIASKTVWERCKLALKANASNLHKIKQKMRAVYAWDKESLYIDYLFIYTHCEILKYQYSCEFFLLNCLNSVLPTSIKTVLLVGYFEYLRILPYDPKRISDDITFLLEYLAENGSNDFIEALVNSDSNLQLNSSYSYQYIQLQTFYPFFSYSLNLLGCSVLLNDETVELHHCSKRIIIKNKKIFQFLFKFMVKTIAYGLCVARNEVLFCFAKFIKNSNGSDEDKFSMTINY